MADRPVRLQLSRRKGFDLQALSLATNGLPAVRVSRPGLFGNPFVAHDWQAAFRAVALGFRGDRAGRLGAAVALYRLWLTAELRDIDAGKRDFWDREVMTVRPHVPRESVLARLGELRGKNLACWCPPGQPCHADVLLELANIDAATPPEGE